MCNVIVSSLSSHPTCCSFPAVSMYWNKSSSSNVYCLKCWRVLSFSLFLSILPFLYVVCLNFCLIPYDREDCQCFFKCFLCNISNISLSLSLLPSTPPPPPPPHLSLSVCCLSIFFPAYRWRQKCWARILICFFMTGVGTVVKKSQYFLRVKGLNSRPYLSAN